MSGCFFDKQHPFLPLFSPKHVKNGQNIDFFLRKFGQTKEIIYFCTTKS